MLDNQRKQYQVIRTNVSGNNNNDDCDCNEGFFFFIYLFIYLLSTSVKGSFDLLLDQVNLRKQKCTNLNKSINGSKKTKLNPPAAQK